jgi:hypothetical protein
VERLRSLIATGHPHPFDNWVIAAAIASAVVSWATGLHSHDTLRPAVTGALERVGPILMTPIEVMH